MMIFKNSDDSEISFQTKKSQSQLARYLCFDDQVRLVTLPLFYLKERIINQHGYSSEAAQFLSWAFASVLFLSSQFKNQEKIKMTVQTTGLGEGWLAEANAFGEVRGYLFKPETIFNPFEKWLGEGTMTVTKFLEVNKFHPVSSTISGEMGNIAQDLEHFLLLSDQIESRVIMSKQWAGLMQALPNCPAEIWKEAQQFFLQLNWDVEAVSIETTRSVEDQLKNYPFIRKLDSYRVEFYCSCHKDRFASYLRALPAEEKKDIQLTEQFPLELRCHYCSSVYAFTREEIDALFDVS